MPQPSDSRAERFHEYLAHMARFIGHKDRYEPLHAYLTGLCLPGERKSIEPMAARIDPLHVQARHESMHHFVANAPWDDVDLLRIARSQVLDQMDRHGGIEVWIVDDTGIPKKGCKSVGVVKQYCGILGKKENCQVAVSLSVANEAVSVPVAYRLYLPETWSTDLRRRMATGIPNDVVFRKKWQLSLEQIAWLHNEGVPIAPIIADAGYGNITEYRDQLTEWRLPYVLGITGNTCIWPPGKQPSKPKRVHRMGRTPILLRRSADNAPISVEIYARNLPMSAWHDMTWREGTKGAMHSLFAFARVRPSHGDFRRKEMRSKEWLIIEWIPEERRPTRYWLSTLPPDASREELLRLMKIRWRIERDYEELKSEFGLDHYEGRNWRGFHHHASLCISAYAFMAAERARFSPSATFSFLQSPPLPTGFRARGSPVPC